MKKIVNLDDKVKDKCYEDVSEMIEGLSDYDIAVEVKPAEVKIILQELYDLYKEKAIIYQYLDDMSIYFNDIMVSAIEEEHSLTKEFLFDNLSFCQFLQTPVEIEQTDMESTLEKAKMKIKELGGA